MRIAHNKKNARNKTCSQPKETVFHKLHCIEKGARAAGATQHQCARERTKRTLQGGFGSRQNLFILYVVKKTIIILLTPKPLRYMRFK